MKTIGVILAGCGVYDGSEIQEAACALVALDRCGLRAACFAPDVPQFDVVNHRDGKPSAGARNVLEESARIARGAVEPLSRAEARALDGLVIPGGFGAAKNLCDFAQNGANCRVLPELEALMRALYAEGKPMGFACIAPVIAARVLGEHGIALTVGSAEGAVADAMRGWGAVVKPCAADDALADGAHKIASTPAYMSATRIGEVADGLEAMAHALSAML